MNEKILKLIFLILALNFINGCSNIKIAKLSETTKRIDKFNSKGEFVKSYYKQFDIQTKNWYSAKCKNTNYSNTRSEICSFTNVALNQIRIAKENSAQNQSNSNDQEQSNSNDQEQSNSNDQEQSDGPQLFEIGLE